MHLPLSVCSFNHWDVVQVMAEAPANDKWNILKVLANSLYGDLMLICLISTVVFVYFYCIVIRLHCSYIVGPYSGVYTVD